MDFAAQFQAYLITERQVAENTALAYGRDVAQLEEYLKTKKTSLQQCKKQSIVAFLRKLKNKGVATKSLSRKISSIKALYTFLHDRFDIPNIARSLIMPKVERRLPTYLSEGEIQKLLEAANKDCSNKGIRNKVMLFLLYATGTRISELITLTRDKIFFEESSIQISGKGKKERKVPVPRNILHLLRYYLDNVYTKLIPKKIENKRVDQHYLFITVYGNTIKPISRQSFWLILKKILQKASIFKNISPHSLRHSFATHLLQKGADLRSLQILLGHENLTTVQLYTHLDNKEVRIIYDKKHPRA